MVVTLHDLDDRPVRAGSGGDQSALLKGLAVFVIELIAMAMTLVNEIRLISRMGQTAGDERARPGAQSHGAATILDRVLFIQQRDHRVLRGRIEFGAVGVVQAEGAAGEFDDGGLHAQADAEIRDVARCA